MKRTHVFMNVAEQRIQRPIVKLDFFRVAIIV